MSDVPTVGTTPGLAVAGSAAALAVEPGPAYVGLFLMLPTAVADPIIVRGRLLPGLADWQRRIRAPASPAV